MALIGEGVDARVRMPAVGQTVNTLGFAVPKGAHAMTVNCPTVISAATFTIQALYPDEADTTTATWRTISAATGVTLVPLTGIVVSNVAITWNIAQIGGGTLRFVASADQSSVPYDVGVVFHMQG